jgi:hypothetical protein
MATLETDDGRLAFTLQVAGALPHRGLVDDGPVGMNSNLGLLRLRFQSSLFDFVRTLRAELTTTRLPDERLSD